MAEDKETIIKPLLDKNVTLINPSIDVMGDSAFVGAWIPCEVTEITRNKEGKESAKIYFKHLPYYVTDKKELKIVDENLFRNGYALASEPVNIKPHWSIEHIKDFLNGGETPRITDVFREIVGAWKENIEFEDWREYVFKACWDIGTYFAHLSIAYIYDYIGGVKNTGKTKSQDLHACIAFNAIHSGNMSASTIFRMVQNCRSTLCVDESEVLDQMPGKDMSERTYDLRNLLLSGYKKGSPVYRTEKRETTGKLMPEPFEVYGPKAISNIKGLESTIEDRCKTTIMSRATGPARNKEIDMNNPKWAAIRDKLYRVYLANWKRFVEVYNSDLVNIVNECRPPQAEDKKLSGREKELWKPILTIATMIDEAEAQTSEHANPIRDSVYNVYNDVLSVVPPATTYTHSPPTLNEVIMSLALDSIKVKKTEDVLETSEMCLVQALLGLVEKDDFYPVSSIRAAIGKLYDEQQLWITPKWVGNAMKRLGFREKRRVGTGIQIMLTKAKVADVAQRLGIEKIKEEDKDPIRTRLFEAFGTTPFKVSQLPEHFHGDDLKSAVLMLPEMEKRGEAERWPFESEGIEGWQLRRKQ